MRSTARVQLDLRPPIQLNLHGLELRPAQRHMGTPRRFSTAQCVQIVDNLVIAPCGVQILCFTDQIQRVVRATPTDCQWISDERPVQVHRRFARRCRWLQPQQGSDIYPVLDRLITDFFSQSCRVTHIRDIHGRTLCRGERIQNGGQQIVASCRRCIKGLPVWRPGLILATCLDQHP